MNVKNGRIINFCLSVFLWVIIILMRVTGHIEGDWSALVLLLVFVTGYMVLVHILFVELIDDL